MEYDGLISRLSKLDFYIHEVNVYRPLGLICSGIFRKWRPREHSILVKNHIFEQRLLFFLDKRIMFDIIIRQGSSYVALRAGG